MYPSGAGDRRAKDLPASIWMVTACPGYAKSCLYAVFLHPREKKNGHRKPSKSYCPMKNTPETSCCRRPISPITGITGRVKTQVNSRNFSMRIIIRRLLIHLFLRPSNGKKNAAAIRHKMTRGKPSAKTARLSSGNTLSGKIVCGTCGRNYRRITTHGGDVVWRCAGRVEKVKHKCTARTLAQKTIIEELTRQCNMVDLHLDFLPQAVEQIVVETNNCTLRYGKSMRRNGQSFCTYRIIGYANII